MRHFIAIYLLLLSPVLYAQTNKQVKPAKSNPNINISKTISTTVTNQPASIPNSNTNPTTGTVISLKTNKNGSKANKPSELTKPGTDPVINRADTTVNSRRGKAALRKQAAKKEKAVLKNGN
jgi:hypothetical protein